MFILLQLVTCDRLGESIHFPSPLGFELVYEADHSIAIFNLSTIIFYFWKFISYIFRIIKAACKAFFRRRSGQSPALNKKRPLCQQPVALKQTL
jgi:hypothetical protein